MRRRGRGLRLWALLAVLLALVLHGRSGTAEATPAASSPRVQIAAKNFTEGRLLAEIMAQLIEQHTELEVDRRYNLGGTTVLFSALKSGEIDLYVEYTGTAWTVMLEDPEKITSPLRAFLTVRHEFETRWDLHWLDPFGFSNSYALGMAESRAEELGIERISDLRPHLSTLRLGFSYEFLEREDGFPGLAKAYDFPAHTPRGMEHGLAYQALAQGEIDVVDTYTTDGKLRAYSVRVLEDDARFFPPYDAAPLVRGELLRSHPELGPLLHRLAFTLDARRMSDLNHAVEDEGLDFDVVAARFLKEEGLLVGDPEATAAEPAADGLLALMWDRRGEITRLAGEHLGLTGLAVLLAILFAVPTGLWLTRHERWAGLVIGTTGVIQTIPSLALLAFMIPIPGLGLGTNSAVVALFLYALLPIVRNTYAGIREVDPDLIEAARGMGLRDLQLLRLVELPLATRTIMAGIRTSTVISIGVATLAAFVGAGGLGHLIITGLQLNDTRLILSGALPAALLALLFDMLLGRLEHRLAPAGLEQGSDG